MEKTFSIPIEIRLKSVHELANKINGFLSEMSPSLPKVDIWHEVGSLFGKGDMAESAVRSTFPNFAKEYEEKTGNAIKLGVTTWKT